MQKTNSTFSKCHWCKYERILIPSFPRFPSVRRGEPGPGGIQLRPGEDESLRQLWPVSIVSNILNILNIIVNIISSMIVILAYFCHFVSQRCFLRNSSVHPSKYRLLRIMMFSSSLIGSKSLRRILFSFEWIEKPQFGLFCKEYKWLTTEG